MKWPAMTLAGGPVEMTERTLRDQSRPVLYHYDPAFIEFFAHTEDLLKKVFQTEYDVVIQQGEAILGLEAAAASMIAPGEKLRARSIIDSEFIGRIETETMVGDLSAIVPSVVGRAWRTGARDVFVDPGDPWPEGYRVGDTWPGG